MSSLRLANLFLTPSSRWRGSSLSILAYSYSLPRHVGRSFHRSAVALKPKQQDQPTKRDSPKSEAEIMQELQNLAAYEHHLGVDVWNQPLQTLDLMIPSWTSKRPNASIVDHVKAIQQTQTNWFRNALNMWRIAKDNAFPDVKVKSKWSLQILKTETTPWLAGLRRSALDVYKSLNEAVAANDQKAVMKYTADSYRETIKNRIQSRGKDNTYVWKLHNENSPCKVVSIRSYVGNMGKHEPKFGNRLVIQALVKFDTNQSLQVYDKKGKLLAGDGQPKRVVEYLIFQKKGWINAPWVIREQLFEGLDSNFTAAG